MSFRQKAQANPVWRSDWRKTKLDEASLHKYRRIDDVDIMMELLLSLVAVLPLSFGKKEGWYCEECLVFLEGWNFCMSDSLWQKK